MHQSHRQESDVTIAPQELPTPAPDSGELTAAELVQVAGGTEGAPGGPGHHTSRSGV
jgi:hypothetical protein